MKNVVFVLKGYSHQFGKTDVFGVYSSRELAQSKIDESKSVGINIDFEIKEFVVFNE